MARVQTTIQVVLWLVSASYLSAFLSLFFQVPGLYGPRGVTPVRALFPPNSEPFLSNWMSRPTLLWLAYSAGLDPSSGMLLLTLLGTVLSFITLVVRRARSPLSYLALYLFYLSLHQVGGVFLWFQWDALLLEAGILAVFLAPLEPLLFLSPADTPWDSLKLWMVRWLAFRLIFCSGVVKLSAKCPTWWGLTTLQIHFESQCIPSQLGWLLHHAPEWILRLSVVLTFFTEIAAPLLFLVPSRLLRFVSFLLQAQLVLGINLSGNYNFFGILTLAVSFALLDDELLSPFSAKKKRGVWKWFSILDYVVVAPLVLAIFGYYLVTLFNVQLSLDPLRVNSSVGFSHQEWDQWVGWVVPLTVWAGLLWLLYEITSAILRSLTEPAGLISKFLNLAAAYAYSLLALFLFLHSLPSYAQIDSKFRSTLPPVLLAWEQALSPYSVASAYGPFRRITGVGGRPEIVLEWSNQLEGDWQEYEFLYKPGELSRGPPFLAPHQPRLDWQMWFAALSSYHQAPWVIQLINRLLHNESTVQALMGDPPPRPVYVRASRYLYHFRGQEDKEWWRREKREEYVPPLTHDHKTVLDFLKNAGIWSEAAAGDSLADKLIYKFYWSVHDSIAPHTAIWAVLLLALSVLTADVATARCGVCVSALVPLATLLGGGIVCYLLTLNAR